MLRLVGAWANAVLEACTLGLFLVRRKNGVSAFLLLSSWVPT